MKRRLVSVVRGVLSIPLFLGLALAVLFVLCVALTCALIDGLDLL